MDSHSQTKISVPLSVPKKYHETHLQNYNEVTKNTKHLFLFAGDQKIEHLNQDFYGKNIPADCADPKHLFNIANSAHIGAFATQLGLIARYGEQFPNISYIIKANAKT